MIKLTKKLLKLEAPSSPAITVGPMMTTAFLYLLFLLPFVSPDPDPDAIPVPIAKLPISDRDLIEFALNLEYLEAEFFLYGSMGRGLDSLQPNLTGAGPPPIGARMAKLTPGFRNIITQFAFQEVGHIRAIKRTIPGFSRPLLNLTVQAFATAMNKAFGRPLFPPFNPYANNINYMLASYMIPYVGLTGYVGANPKLISPRAKKLVAGLLGVEAGQDAVLRTLLYKLASVRVIPYRITVAEFTNRISRLRNNLARAGLKDEGLVIPAYQSVEGKITGNLLIADTNSLSYGRTPEEILRIVYGSGNEHIRGGFYPRGASGSIARKYLRKFTNNNLDN